MTRFPLFLAALLLGSCNSAPPQIAVSDAWARETVQGQAATAAYLIIRNSGGSGDRLISVSSPDAAETSLHSSTNEDGVARMRPLNQGLPIPAGGTASLAPGGNHIMLMGPRQALTAGTAIELRLRFEHSGERVVQAQVRDAGPAAMHTGH